MFLTVWPLVHSLCARVFPFFISINLLLIKNISYGITERIKNKMNTLIRITLKNQRRLIYQVLSKVNKFTSNSLPFFDHPTNNKGKKVKKGNYIKSPRVCTLFILGPKLMKSFQFGASIHLLYAGNNRAKKGRKPLIKLCVSPGACS